MKKMLSYFSVLLFLAVGIFLVFNALNTFFKEDTDKKMLDETKQETLQIVAVGDSLTEGVGDSSNDGGYVPVVADLLRETKQFKEVTTSNYGKTGDRSEQILERFYKNDNMQQDIQSADIIVLTVGGNDIIQTFKKDFLSLSQENFIAPKEKYASNVKTLFSEIQELNPEVAIYVFGIYNPYYVYFPDIHEMQEILDDWNQTTKDLVQETDNASFLSIDDLFNQTTVEENEGALTANATGTAIDRPLNPFLFEKDLFHPNDSGYKLMGELLFQVLSEE